MGREAQGHAWASQAAMDFQIPSQASLHGILKSIAHSATKMALRLRLAQKSFGKNGLSLEFQAGRCFEKSIRKPACEFFSQQIQHSLRE
jgi:hypothetical protein